MIGGGGGFFSLGPESCTAGYATSASIRLASGVPSSSLLASSSSRNKSSPRVCSVVSASVALCVAAGLVLVFVPSSPDNPGEPEGKSFIAAIYLAASSGSEIRLSLASRRFLGGSNSPVNPPDAASLVLLTGSGGGCVDGSGMETVAETDTFGTGVPDDDDEEVPGAGRDDFFCTLRGAEDGMGAGGGVAGDSLRAGLWGVFPVVVGGSVATEATGPNAPLGLAVKFKGTEVPKWSIERAGDSAL